VLLFKIHPFRFLDEEELEHILNSESFPCARPSPSQFTVYNPLSVAVRIKCTTGEVPYKIQETKKRHKFVVVVLSFFCPEFTWEMFWYTNCHLTANSRILMPYIEYS